MQSKWGILVATLIICLALLIPPSHAKDNSDDPDLGE
jgi:hypothetical protein